MLELPSHTLLHKKKTSRTKGRPALPGPTPKSALAALGFHPQTQKLELNIK